MPRFTTSNLIIGTLSVLLVAACIALGVVWTQKNSLSSDNTALATDNHILNDQVNAATAATPTPAPVATATPTPTPVIKATATPVATATPTPMPTTKSKL